MNQPFEPVINELVEKLMLVPSKILNPVIRIVELRRMEEC